MTQIFVSYSHKNRSYLGKGELIDYLKKGLKGKAKFWVDDKISAGSFWDENIHENILNSQIAIVLISKDFINSKYINKVEIRKFLTATIKKFVIFPIIISPCNPQKLKWLTERQYIPGGNQSIEKDFPKGKKRDALYRKILTDLKEKIAYVRKPEITTGQALSSMVNIINAIETDLLDVCKLDYLKDKTHSLMFEGKSDELMAVKKAGRDSYLRIVKFGELKEYLKPRDFRIIISRHKELLALFSKWVVIDNRRVEATTAKEKKSLIGKRSQVILAMVTNLVVILKYLNDIGFDLDDHYSRIYDHLGVLQKSRAMNSR